MHPNCIFRPVGRIVARYIINRHQNVNCCWQGIILKQLEKHQRDQREIIKKDGRYAC